MSNAEGFSAIRDFKQSLEWLFCLPSLENGKQSAEAFSLFLLECEGG
jgi:hypothetical protein